VSENKLSHKQILKTDKDHKRAAAAANLIYVNNNDMAGISRVKKGKGYCYYYKNEIVSDEETLKRIKKLAIPPSWSNVWICASANGHIQATGLDLNKRKQYRYHTDWNLLRGETKFHRLYEFGKTLPLLRKKISSDINSPQLSADKVLATAIRIMEETYIRVGNNDYEKLYGSYGLTTLKDQHVSIKKDEISFSFTGKKGIDHSIKLKNKKLASIVKQCRDIPGRQLFQYYDEQGNRKHIDSGMLNAYIKNATGSDFSAKDFRTWAGSLQAIQCFRSIRNWETEAEKKKNIIAVLDTVSAKLGNSPAICKKYYVHPGLIRLYQEKKLHSFLSKLAPEKHSSQQRLSSAEKTLLQILRRCF